MDLTGIAYRLFALEGTVMLEGSAFGVAVGVPCGCLDVSLMQEPLLFLKTRSLLLGNRSCGRCEPRLPGSSPVSGRR